MGLIKRLARKNFKAWDGILICYMVYDPRKEGKNVLSFGIHPDLKKDERLNELLKESADRIRLFYKINPGLLEEALGGRE